jgi:hypothetical protein
LDFPSIRFGGTSELCFFERKRELADEKDCFDIGMLLQLVTAVKDE